MQLGELQHQVERFARRGVSIVGLSVDAPSDSEMVIERLGLTFGLGSDPEQTVVKQFGVQNPDTQELAIHAVYIVDRAGKVYYRKVGSRRPVSQELIDAIDAHRGDYPRTDETVEPRQRINVAYPQNELQAIVTVARVDRLPEGIDVSAFAQSLELARAGFFDDSLIVFKDLMRTHVGLGEAALLDTAAWYTRTLMFSDAPDAIEAGRRLAERLDRVRELEAAVAATDDADARDALQQTLAKARAGLSKARAEIRANADGWGLRFAKTTLRSRREIAHAAIRLNPARVE